jgi:hypothetical protein
VQRSHQDLLLGVARSSVTLSFSPRLH